MQERGRIARAAGAVSGATLISRVLGYARDMVLAFYFGATGLSDTFFVAFRIPNLLRELFAEGSISSAFIPVLTEYQSRDEMESRYLVRVALTFFTMSAGAVTLLGIIFAPQIVSLIAPGFLSLPAKFDLTVKLTRVMFPFLLFISMAALLMGALNTRRVFFVPAVAPAMLNISVIASVIGLASVLAEPVMAVAIGVTLGGFLQFAFQGPAFLREGYSMRPALAPGHPGLRKMLALLLPVTLGMAVAQINIVVSSVLASFMQGGSITYLFYSMRLVQFPIGVFGVAMGMAVLPSLSRHAINGDFKSLRGDFSFALRLLFFISIPAMAGLIALREPIVNLLFERGAFDHRATLGTAEALMYYSVGVWAFVGVRVLTPTFYSMQDTRAPVKSAVVALVANVLLSLALMGPLKHSGLALANSLSSMLNFVLLFYLLRKRLGHLEGRRILSTFARVAAASALMGLAAWWAVRGEVWAGPGHTSLKAGWLFAVIAAAVCLYALLCRALKCEELDFVMDMLREKFRKKEK